MPQTFFSITEMTEAMPGVYLLWLEAPALASALRPGQFLMVGCGPDCLLRRPFSLHRVGGPERPGQVALLFRVVGKGTRWLSQRHAGEALDVLGPLGNGFTIPSDRRKLLLVAGGLGVAPLAALALGLLGQGRQATLLLGASTAQHLYPQGLLPPGLEVILATEDGSAGERGQATDILPGLLGRGGHIFACGPAAMYRTMQGLSPRFPQLGEAQVSVEERLGCGYGACFGCSIETKAGMRRACRDGPIFPLGDLIL